MMASTKKDWAWQDLISLEMPCIRKSAKAEKTLHSLNLFHGFWHSVHRLRRQGKKLDKMNLVGTQFGEQLPAAQLHWIIADEKECIVVECMVDGCMCMTIL